MVKIIRVFNTIVIILFATMAMGCNRINNSRKEGIRIISSEEGQKIIESENDIIILDVRTKSEYDEGHVRGAVLLPVDDVEKGIDKLLKDKEAKILIYCRTGVRSNKAALKLQQLGYNNIYDFGGIVDYKGETEK